MPTLGITGGLASGKGTAAEAFAGLGADVIDADRIAHQLIGGGGPCVDEIRRIFGDQVISGGAVNRPALARVVFADRAELSKLEAIVHPEVRRVMQSRIDEIRKSDPDKVIVIDIPLLFEAGMEDMVDISIVVRCEERQQLARATEALKIAKQDALLRIQSQMPLKEKEQRADIVIDNTGSKLELTKEVKRIWQKVQSTQGR